MTTPLAAEIYLLRHQLETSGRKNAVFNPNNEPLEKLPVIYGFNNGGRPGWFSAVSIAEDGNCLGSHVCSDEGYMPYDLGILEGSRPDRHTDEYQKHYPNGYRMEWVPTDQLDGHTGLQKAFELNKLLPKEEKKEEAA